MKALQAEHDLGHGVASPIEPETIRTRQSRTFSMGGSRDLVHEGVHVSAKPTSPPPFSPLRVTRRGIYPTCTRANLQQNY